MWERSAVRQPDSFESYQWSPSIPGTWHCTICHTRGVWNRRSRSGSAGCAFLRKSKSIQYAKCFVSRISIFGVFSEFGDWLAICVIFNTLSESETVTVSGAEKSGAFEWDSNRWMSLIAPPRSPSPRLNLRQNVDADAPEREPMEFTAAYFSDLF